MGIGSKEMYKSELSGFGATLSPSELLFTSPVGLHNKHKLGRSGLRELMVGQLIVTEVRRDPPRSRAHI
jgi:hypothetical protein